MPCGVRSYIYAERGLAMSGRFDELRREYPQFVYSGYSVSEHEDGLHLSFDFFYPRSVRISSADEARRKKS